MTNDEFSARIEAAYREALRGADAITAEAKRVLAEAEAERDAARLARQTALAEGAAEALADARARWLRELVERAVRAGRAAGEIEAWLGADAVLIAEVTEALAPRPAAAPAATTDASDWQLETTQSGRGGEVRFRSPTASFELWWEFAGGDALAIVELPSAAQWTARTGLPSEQRQDVADFLGRELVARQAPGGRYEIGDDFLTLYSGRSRTS